MIRMNVNITKTEFFDESEILDIIDENYQNYLYEELIVALSLCGQASLRIHSFEPPFKKTDVELFELVMSVRERYANEFSTCGLKRLEIPE